MIASRLRTRDVIVVDTVYTGFVRSDRRGIVLSLTAEEVRSLHDGADRFRLTSSGQLFAVPSEPTTILVKE